MKYFYFLLYFILTVFSCKDNSYLIFKNKYSEGYLNKILITSKKAILKQLSDNKYKHFIDINYSSDDQGIAIRLKKNGHERGCIVFLKNVGSVENAAAIAGIDAAFFDKRFLPLKEKELKDIEIEITIIDKLIELKDINDFKIGQHSLLIENYSFRGFLQAQIAIEENYNKKEFLEALCKKAGLKKDNYKNKQNKIYRANTVYFKKKITDIEM